MKLRAVNIVKKYKNKSIINNITLHVSIGEVIAILGPNGAGKTTAFYIIAGLMQPDSGFIYLDNNDITKEPTYIRARRGIGYLPQEPSIFENLTVSDNIRGVLEYMPYTRAQTFDRLNELLHTFSITHLANAKARTLSGGERRRLEIARTLAYQPSFLLLDEPLAGVDPVSVQDIHLLIRDLKKKGLGIIITDHNVRETLKIVERSYILHNGIILTSGNARHITNHPKVKEIYLGKNFTV